MRRREPEPEAPLWRPRSQFYLDPRDAAGKDHPARIKALAAMKKLLSTPNSMTKDTLVERYYETHQDVSETTIEAISGKRGVVLVRQWRQPAEPVTFEAPDETEAP